MLGGSRVFSFSNSERYPWGELLSMVIPFEDLAPGRLRWEALEEHFERRHHQPGELSWLERRTEMASTIHGMRAPILPVGGGSTSERRTRERGSREVLGPDKKPHDRAAFYFFVSPSRLPAGGLTTRPFQCSSGGSGGHCHPFLTKG